LVESILSANWVTLSGDHYLEAAQWFWKKGLRNGSYTKWYLILGKLVTQPTHQYFDLTIGYGISQRCLALWSEAHSVFTGVVRHAGMQAAFLYQAQALLELAILLRYQGDYIGALEALDHIDNFVQPIPPDLYSRTVVERIEIALERNDIPNANSLLTSLDNDNDGKLILQLEIYAKDTNDGNEMPYWVPISDKLVLEYDYSASLTARIHILIGRIYEKMSDIKLATNHLAIAQSLLMDTDNDPFALARTQSNLAALLTASDQFLEAEELLKV
jgi:tetratricopeptide (TPR) repeat protein